MPASCRFADVNDCRLAIISPNDPGAMVQYAEECRTLGIPFIWDPGQQCARMSGPELQDGLEGSALVICNDYEFELIRQKTSIDEDSVLEHTQALVVTRGRERVLDLYLGRPAGRARGAADADRRSDGRRRRVPCGLHEGAVARADRADHVVCARMGAVAATYALEHLGGQSHAFTWPSSTPATRPTSARLGVRRVNLAAGLTCAAVAWVALCSTAPSRCREGGCRC